MPRDLALRLLGGGCLPDFAGKFGYPSIAALSINPGFDVTGELQTIENVCLRSRLGTRTMSPLNLPDVFARQPASAFASLPPYRQPVA